MDGDGTTTGGVSPSVGEEDVDAVGDAEDVDAVGGGAGRSWERADIIAWRWPGR